ncbi:DUF2231 domain-containing protein [uncultured Jatrophihabitans sp.]|uniref:DUF2231 domain-containing protein n=1 Tax=uncultured Jatrophihabitans sp. TaxID=1610747 RepID=UPI0035CBACE8
MPVTIGGLPAHVLLVHAVVVLLPLAAIMLVVGVLWPTARRKFGVLTPLLALVGLALVPVTTHAGEWLEGRLPHSRAIEHHADLGDQLLPWAAGLFVMAAAVWWVGRRRELLWRRPADDDHEADRHDADAPASGSGGTATMTRKAEAPTLAVAPLWLTAVLTVLSIAVAVGVSIMLYRIGDSGAHAVWNGVGSSGR